MLIKKNRIIFEQSDMAFVEKFGVLDAAEMVLNYKTVCTLPFVYDADQLAAFLKIGRKDFFDLMKHCDTFYRPISLKKKNGTYRQIYEPNDILKRIQKKILDKILSQLPISQYAKAYRTGGTLIDNAAAHIGKRYVLKLDITDFFGSISFEQVYSAAFHTKYFPKQIGVLLTMLCCRKEVLPQGAPTSPALSNIVMCHFDNYIGSWCEARAIAYTRYCDDMTFSSDRPLFGVYQKVKTMLEEVGFELNEKKTHFISNASRQSVTGITVNEKLSVPIHYKRRLRQEIYYTLKFGLAEQIVRSDKTEFFMNARPDVSKYYNHLLGQIGFVLQIEPENTWFQNAIIKLKSSSFLQGEMELWRQ